MAEPDYYRILGVPPSATLKQIKSAYRKLVKKYHPDLFATSSAKARATAAFHKINQAYAVLGDPKRRSYYDQIRAQEAANVRPGPAAAPRSPSASRKKVLVNPATLLWDVIRRSTAKLRMSATIFLSRNQTAARVTSFFVSQLCRRISPNVFTRRSRWKAALIFGCFVLVWILMSLWKEPGAATNWALLENSVVEPLRPISPTFHEPNWTVLAYYPSISQCARDLKDKVTSDEQEGARAFFDERDGTMAITVQVKNETALAEEYFHAKLRRSAAQTADPQLLKEQARQEASEFVREHGVIQRVRKVQCREVAQPEPESWLWRIMKHAGLIS